MVKIFKRISQEIARIIVNSASRKTRERLYFLPLIGPYLQKTLKGILCALLYSDSFQWFKFKSVYRSGLEMRLKLPEESEFYLETHDPDVTGLLSKFVKSGFNVVDIGAHIGYFTLLISRLVGPRGKVFAVEPLPGNVLRLQEHLFKNKCDQNTKVFQFAFAERDGEGAFADFGISTIARFASSESCSNISSRLINRRVVKCRSFDSFIKDHSFKSLDFVKIDVEGAELRVLRGMERTVGIYRPKLLIEFHNQKIIKEIMELLRERGYSAYIDGGLFKKSDFCQEKMLGKNVLFVDE